MTDKELTLRIDQARWWALQELPFYGSLAMGLKDVLSDVPTACTDGVRIIWGRKYLSTLTQEEIRYLLLHETMHAAHGHLWRLPPDRQGNDAGDYCIEKTLRNIPGTKMPKGGLICPPEWMELAEEEIYTHLPKSDGSGPGIGDFEAPADDAIPGDEEGKPSEGGHSLKDEWERRVIQAQQAANAMGKGDLPSELQKVLDRIRVQPIDWRREMADFVRTVISTRNDWSRSSRRHAWQPVIHPRKRADGFGIVVFCRDTSGSISPEMCAEFSAHISMAIAEVGCRAVVLDCDCAIQAEYNLEPGDECPLTAKGGGGTSHVPIWDRLAKMSEEGDQIAGVVCLTDMESSFPESDGGIASLWLSTTKLVAPFGRTVPI